MEGGVLPGAASLAGVPALRLPFCLPLTQQVGVDEDEELVRADGGDVALTIDARLVQQHRVEVGAGKVQELPGGAGESCWSVLGQLSLPTPRNRARVLRDGGSHLFRSCELFLRFWWCSIWGCPHMAQCTSDAAGRGCP